MRIVAVADTHLGHEVLRVPDGDVFVHAGDMCRRGTMEELDECVAWIAALPHRHKVIVAGNHDWVFAREPAEARRRLQGMTYLEDQACVIEGVRFYGSPWQPEFCGWAFNLPRGPALERVWQQIPAGIDVLITHGPPHGIGDRTFEHHAGCEALRARIAEVAPKLHVFGHIHEDGGAWRVGATVCANVTTVEGDRAPTVFDVIDGVVTAVAIPKPW